MSPDSGLHPTPGLNTESGEVPDELEIWMNVPAALLKCSGRTDVKYNLHEDIADLIKQFREFGVKSVVVNYFDPVDEHWNKEQEEIRDDSDLILFWRRSGMGNWFGKGAYDAHIKYKGVIPTYLYYRTLMNNTCYFYTYAVSEILNEKDFRKYSKVYFGSRCYAKQILNDIMGFDKTENELVKSEKRFKFQPYQFYESYFGK